MTVERRHVGKRLAALVINHASGTAYLAGQVADDARRVAANSRSWWRNSRLALNRAMPIAYFDRLGVPRLS